MAIEKKGSTFNIDGTDEQDDTVSGQDPKKSTTTDTTRETASQTTETASPSYPGKGSYNQQTAVKQARNAMGKTPVPETQQKKGLSKGTKDKMNIAATGIMGAASGITGALANMGTISEGLVHGALNPSATGINEMKNLTNATRDSAKAIQGGVRDMDKAINDMKKKSKDLKKISIPTIKTDLDKIYDDAVKQVDPNKKYEELNSAQRKRVDEIKDQALMQYFKDKGIDPSRIDPNSPEARAVFAKEQENVRNETFVGREHRIENRSEKGAIREIRDMNKEMKDDIIKEMDKPKRDLIQREYDFFNDPSYQNLSPAEKKKYELAYQADKYFMDENSYNDTTGVFSDDLAKKIIREAWNQKSKTSDPAEMQALDEVIGELTAQRLALSDEKLDVAKDAEMISYVGSMGSMDKFLKNAFKHDRQELTYNDNSALSDKNRFGIGLGDKHIRAADRYVDAKMLDFQRRNIDPFDDQFANDPEVRQFRHDLNRVTVAKIRNKVHNNIDGDMVEAKLANVDPNGDAVRTININKETGEILINERLAKVYEPIIQDVKTQVKAAVDDMLAEVVDAGQQALANGGSMDIWSHGFESAYNDIAKELQDKFGLFEMHEVGSNAESETTQRDLIGKLVEQGVDEATAQEDVRALIEDYVQQTVPMIANAMMQQQQAYNHQRHQDAQAQIDATNNVAQAATRGANDVAQATTEAGAYVGTKVEEAGGVPPAGKKSSGKRVKNRGKKDYSPNNDLSSATEYDLNDRTVFGTLPAMSKPLDQMGLQDFQDLTTDIGNRYSGKGISFDADGNPVFGPNVTDADKAAFNKEVLSRDRMMLTKMLAYASSVNTPEGRMARQAVQDLWGAKDNEVKAFGTTTQRHIKDALVALSKQDGFGNMMMESMGLDPNDTDMLQNIMPQSIYNKHFGPNASPSQSGLDDAWRDYVSANLAHNGMVLHL